jgi:D-inositol-3-phosphate glycosyltransferase
VAVEAQACGTPVVAASVGGLRTAVHDGVSGILVDGHDPASYARAVRGLLTDPAALARLSAGAREHASRFGWGATVDALLRVYTGAMSTVAAAVDA